MNTQNNNQNGRGFAQTEEEKKRQADQGGQGGQQGGSGSSTSNSYQDAGRDASSQSDDSSSRDAA